MIKFKSKYTYASVIALFISSSCNFYNSNNRMLEKHFIFRNCHGKSHLVSTSNTSLHSIKKEIKDKIGYAIVDQKLYYNGKQLTKYSELTSIPNYSSFILNMPIKGGGPGSNDACQAPNIGKGSKKVAELKNGLPSWTGNKKGFNIAIICPDKSCISHKYKYFVWIPQKGKIFFPAQLNYRGYRCTACGKLFRNSECVKGYSFVKCNYSIIGNKTKSREDLPYEENLEDVNLSDSINQSGKVANYISNDWTWWGHLEIFVSY